MFRHHLFFSSFIFRLASGVLENLKYRDRIELGSVDGDTVTLPFVTLSENSEEFLRTERDCQCARIEHRSWCAQPVCVYYELINWNGANII